MKFRFSRSSRNKKILIPTTPTNGNPLNTEDPFGSKEETFFDSQAWLDSDEDDYLSVNGDFTPSRGSFSDNQSISNGNTQFDKAPDLNTESSLSSPTDKKKRLSQLLQDSLGGDEDQNMTNGELETPPVNTLPPSKSTIGISKLFTSLSRSNSVRSGDRTPNRYSRSERETSPKAGHCCLPSLVTSRSFSERKKRLSADAFRS